MKLLIIEDDDTIRNELAYFLNASGYEVLSITYFKYITIQVLHINPHLILLDIHLPYEDGHTL